MIQQNASVKHKVQNIANISIAIAKETSIDERQFVLFTIIALRRTKTSTRSAEDNIIIYMYTFLILYIVIYFISYHCI